jgi:autotransporter-associated beta strand protein
MLGYPSSSPRYGSQLIILLMSSFVLIQFAAAESFDWRTAGGYNWNSTVKGQFGGTCWDFGPTACFEAKYMITRNDTNFVPDLSEQQNCWENSPDMGSTQGGGGFDVIAGYFTTHGVVSETEIPVDPNSANWDTPPGGYPFLTTGWQNRVWKTTSYQLNIANTSDTTANTAILKNAIKTTGPVFLDINPGELFSNVADLRASNYVYSPGGGHAVSLVGFVDDATCPTGGYWIIKNSWTSANGDNGYNYLPYGSSVEANHCQNTLGAVYYTGPMYHTGPWDATGVDHTGTAATNTWKGTTNATWNTSSGTAGNWSNNSTGQAFTWLNQELQAVFDGTGNNKAITVSGKVNAHGLTISTSGYSFAPADSNSALTITSGGVTSTDNVNFTTPVFIGGPQSWNVAAGKTLTVSGALHTIISDLTFSGAGNTTISGPIDGGGVINTLGGAKPGGLIQTGTGAVTLSGTTNFSGNITTQAGSGTLYISPPGGGSATFDGAWFGGGTISINSSGTFTLGNGASNFTGTLIWQQPVSLIFTPAAGVTSAYGGQISNNGSVTQNGPGTTVFADRTTNKNNYTGGTTISAGILRANSGNGIPTSSFLTIDGGILQSYGTGTTTFSRALGTSGGAFEWTLNGGGFSAGSGALNVSIPGGTLTWSSNAADAGSKILGTLKLSSPTTTNVTTLLNAINLNGADRTVFVDDNPAATADFAVMSGAISGSAGLIKSGNGLLKLTGVNNYTGNTTISGGVLQANLGTGLPSGSYLVLNGGVLENTSTSFTRSLGTTQSGSYFEWTANGGGFSPCGSALTVNIGGDGRTLTWGSTPGTNIMGTLKLGSATATANVTFQNGLNLGGGTQTIEANGNYTAYLPGFITGTGSLIKTGSGTLVFSGTGNTYTGSTSIQGGTVYLNKSTGYAIPGDFNIANASTYLVVQGANQFPTTANVSFSGTGDPHFELYGHSITVAGINSRVGGVIENTEGESISGNGALTVNNTADCYYGAYIRNTAWGSGTISLTKSGTGTLTLVGGGIQYTGGTTISGGKLVLQDTYDSNFAARSIINNGTLELDPVNSAFAINGVISGSGPVNVSNGGNTLTLSGSSGNTYTGATTISSGRVVLAKTSGYAIPGNCTLASQAAFVVVTSPTQIPTNAIVTLVGDYDGNQNPHFEVYGNTITLEAITGTGGAIENTENETGVANGTLNINNTGNYALSGVILRDGTSGTFSLLKSGPGTLTLTGSYCGQYTGGLKVTAGTLDYSGGSLPNCNYTITGGTLNIGNRSPSIKTFQIIGGTVTGTTGVLTSNAAYDVQAGTISAILGGSVGLNKTTAGTAILTGSNSYTGTTTISAGTLQLGAGESTGSLSSSTNVVINSGATFDVNRSSGALTFSSKISGTGTLTKDGAGVLTLSGSNTFSGNLVVNGGTLNYSGNSTQPAGNYTIAGGLLYLPARSQSIGAFQITGGTVTGGTLTSNTDYDVQAGTVNTILAGGSTIDLNKTGSGTAILAGANTYAGLTTVSAGTLQLGNNGTTGSLTSSSGVVINAGGTLDVNRSNAFTLSNSISGTGKLVKDGGSTLTLSGSNSFSGNVVVNSGTLAFSSAAALPAANYMIIGGTLNTGVLSKTIGGFQITGGTVTGSGTLTSNTAYDLQSGTVSVGLGGNAGLIKSTSGTVSLTKSLPGGNYAISAGTLEIGALSPSIGGFQITGGTFTGTGTLTSNTAFDIQGGTVDAVLAGNSGLTKTQNGVAVLKKVNTYSGTTLISDGTLALSASGQINPLSLIDNDATFLITGGSHTLGAINGTGSTLVDDTTQLNVFSIVQDTLSIGGNHSSLLPPDSPGVSQNTSIPEPSALALLATLGVMLAAAYLKTK